MLLHNSSLTCIYPGRSQEGLNKETDTHGRRGSNSNLANGCQVACGTEVDVVSELPIDGVSSLKIMHRSRDTILYTALSNGVSMSETGVTLTACTVPVASRLPNKMH